MKGTENEWERQRNDCIECQSKIASAIVDTEKLALRRRMHLSIGVQQLHSDRVENETFDQASVHIRKSNRRSLTHNPN